MQTDPTAPGDGASPEVLALAKVVARLRAEVADLEGLVSVAGVLERAKGVLMAREGVSADAAYETLVRRAESRGTTLIEECWVTLGGIRPKPGAACPPAADPVTASGRTTPEGVLPAFGADPRPGRDERDARTLSAGLAVALTDARSTDDTAEILHEALRVPLAVDGVMIYTLDGAGRLELIGHSGIDEVLAAQWQGIPPLSGVAALEAITSGEPRWLDDPARDAERYRLIGPPERWPTRAWIPVRGADTVTCAIGFFRKASTPSAVRSGPCSNRPCACAVAPCGSSSTEPPGRRTWTWPPSRACSTPCPGR